MLKETLSLNHKHILVTGSAGFIGSYLCRVLLKECEGATIVGVDNLNAYYDPSLKVARLREIDAVATKSRSTWQFEKGDLSDASFVQKVFEKYPFDIVVNLAAQAGVRYSIENPQTYIQSNILGFFNLLEACRHSYDAGKKGVSHLVFASSSSVYGANEKTPYSVDDKTDQPVSLYAATKKCDELLAHSYSKLYDIPCTGLRFFTVYGPEGRPDMAYFSFADSLVSGKRIRLFNEGNCKRDFTYIDDVVEGILRVTKRPPERKPGGDSLPIPPYRLYNIGNSTPIPLFEFVETLGQELIAAKVLPESFSIKEHCDFVPMQAGDVVITYADVSKLEEDCGYKPTTTLREGLRRFAVWYSSYLQ